MKPLIDIVVFEIENTRNRRDTGSWKITLRFGPEDSEEVYDAIDKLAMSARELKEEDPNFTAFQDLDDSWGLMDEFVGFEAD